LDTIVEYLAKNFGEEKKKSSQEAHAVRSAPVTPARAIR
jgi:hypothetical protein